MTRVIRGLFFAVLLVAPLAAHADSATTTTPSDSASSLQPTGSSSTGVGASSLLQPAGSSSSPLQSADASGGGVAQSGTQDIQQSGSSDQAKLLVEGDGDAPHALTSGINISWLGYILIVLVAATIGTGTASLWQRRTAESAS